MYHSEWTLAGIDDVIARGRLDDWKELRDAATNHTEIREKVLRVAIPHLSDPYAQRYHFWSAYVPSTLAFPQTKNTMIEWQAKPMGSNNERWAEGTQAFRVLDRVEIENFTVGKPVTIGEAFSAGDDWLQNLVIRVRNISGQQLAAIQVTLVLPQMGPGSPDVVYCYGCAPDEKNKGIAAGEVVELKMIGGGFYDFVKARAAEKGGISQISKAQIRAMYVTLPDSTRWVSGCIKTADAKNACAQ